MPSPFPGMDPYLENPARWPSFHTKFIVEMHAALNENLGPAYVAEVEERVYVSKADDSGRAAIVPDAIVMVASEVNERRRLPSHSTSTITAPVEAITILSETIHERNVVIYHAEANAVITIIELLSPTNKTPRANVRDNYSQKRDDILVSDAHLVEIDLLRQGVPFVAEQLLAGADYHVHAVRAETRPKGKLWRIQIAERLPIIGIPLQGDDPDCPLDLQAVLNSVYSRSSYDRRIDYAVPPVPPLMPQQEQWAENILKSKGLRS